MSELSIGLLLEGIARRLHHFLLASHCVLAIGDHLLRNTETLLISWILFLTSQR